MPSDPRHDRSVAAKPEDPPDWAAGDSDMDPDAFRAAAHAVVDLMADYLRDVERYPVFPPIEPGTLRPLFPASAPDGPEAIEAILADYRALIEPNATHWQHPGFLAYFGTTASGPGILGEMLTAALGQNPMLWRTSPIGTELEEVVVGWLREALGSARDVRWADHRHRVDLVAHRPCRRASGGRRRRGGGRSRRTTGGEADARLRLRGGALVDREGAHDPGARASRPGPRRDERAVRDGGSGPRGRDRGGPLSRHQADRDRRHGRDDLVDLGRSGRGDRRRRRPRRAVAARRRGIRRSRGAHPGPASAVRRLGASRFDRAQPAQVAVRAARCIAAADGPDGRPPRRVQPRSRISPDVGPGGARPRLQRVHSAARPPLPCVEAVDAHPGLRDRGAPPADRPPLRHGGRVRRLDRCCAGLGTARPGPVLDRLLPPRPTRLGGRGPGRGGADR